MQTNPVNNVSFTSIIPVRVRINGNNSTNQKNIQQACKEVIKVISGPVKDMPQYKNFIKQLGEMDFEFFAKKSWFGYCRTGKTHENVLIKETPSDYFKIIFDRIGNGFITTGKESADLAAIGRKIGIEQQKCKGFGLKDSFELQNAKAAYGDYIRGALGNFNRRITEGFLPETGYKIGNPVAMNIAVDAKAVKRKGVESLKMSLDDVYFSRN